VSSIKSTELMHLKVPVSEGWVPPEDTLAEPSLGSTFFSSLRTTGTSLFLVSEFRHDYARNYTIPLPSTSYLCPTKTDAAILSEGDGEKEVVNKRKVFSPQV
jgi:hypothetical protein